MSIETPTVGDKFTIRVIKNLITNPENSWANSYEFQCTETATIVELFALGTALVDFERLMHDDAVAFTRYIISTWEADSFPYDPSTFVTVPLLVQGAISDITNDNVALGMAWRVNRQASTGRFGNLFFRGVLHENQVSAFAGLPTLSDYTSMGELLSSSVDDSLLANYFGNSATGGFKMVMISADGSQVRNVLNLVSSGVSMIKQDHQWFNRSAPS